MKDDPEWLGEIQSSYPAVLLEVPFGPLCGLLS